MTESGISKKVFVGYMIVEAITQIATTDDNAANKFKYVVVLGVLLIVYLFKQTFLDFMKNVWMVLKNKDEPKTNTH